MRLITKVFICFLMLLAFSAGCKSGSGSLSVSESGSSKGTYIQWDAPQRDASGNQYPQPNDIITGYTIYFGTAKGVYSTGNYTVPASITSVRVEDAVQLLGLAPNRYYCAVTALDKYGNESGFSNEVEADIM
jgi:hypothetical protein